MTKNRLKTKKIKDKGLHCNLLAKRQLKGQQKTERSSRRFGEDFPLHVLKANTVCSRPKESEGPNVGRGPNLPLRRSEFVPRSTS